MKQILIIHQSAENHQGQKILNAPRSILIVDAGNTDFKKSNKIGKSLNRLRVLKGNIILTVLFRKIQNCTKFLRITK